MVKQLVSDFESQADYRAAAVAALVGIGGCAGGGGAANWGAAASRKRAKPSSSKVGEQAVGERVVDGRREITVGFGFDGCSESF